MKRYFLFIVVLLLFFSSADEALAQAVQPTITAGNATGAISACYGTASVSPEVLQFTVSGTDLGGDITVTAPSGFEVSLTAANGYGPNVPLAQTGGVASGTIYVRSSASAGPGPINGSVKLTASGAADKSVNVTAIINALPTVNPVTGPQYNNGDVTTAIDFTGTGNSFTWTNNKPEIGLPASGTGSIPSFTATNTGTSAIQASIRVTPVSYTYGFAPNPGALLTVFNISTNQQVAQIDVGDTPAGVSVSPDGKNVYVTCLNYNKVYVINIAKMAVTAKIDVGSGPMGVVVSPDSKKVYVANENSGYVSVIDAASNTVSSTVFVGSYPYGIAISPDGSKVYVTNSGSNTVSVISTSTNAVIATVTVSTKPIGVAVSPDGTKIYVANSDIHTNTVSVISAATNQVISTFNTGTQPLGVCLSPDGSRLYVSNGADASVSVINTATGLTVTTIPVESTPFGISINRDGRNVFVADIGTGDISVINTTSNTVTGTLAIGGLSQTLGNFLEGGTGCTGTPMPFTITVNPASVTPPVITPGAVTGTITACYGSASASPQVQQFTVSGVNLLYDITATAPSGFEVSLNPTSGYGPNVTVMQTNGTVNNAVIYVRSSATAAIGPINGTVTLTSGPTTQLIHVTGTVNALPTVNAPSVNTINGLTYKNGEVTTEVDFAGTANSFTWTNDTPTIGLPASGVGNIPSFKAVNTGKTPVIATISVTPASFAYAYVANSTSDNVSVININTQQVNNIDVGQRPTGVSVSPDGKSVYIANSGSNSVSVINVAGNTVTTPITLAGASPYNLLVSPDGTKLYVVGLNTQNVTVFSTSNYAKLATIQVGGYPVCLTESPDGNTVYVVNSSNSISVIDTRTNQVSEIPVSPGPNGIAISPDGSQLYAVIPSTNSLDIINTTTKSITSVAVGASPHGVCVSPDGSRVYVTNLDDNTVSVVNPATKQAIAGIGVGEKPEGISISPDGSVLVVANQGSGTATIISTADYNLNSVVSVGSAPVSLGNFIVSGTGCTGKPIKFPITVDPDADAPIITTSTASLPGLNTDYGKYSSADAFTVSGSNLTGGIIITPPNGFEISTNDITFSKTLTVGAGGNLASTQIYVRLAATTPAGNSYHGDITLTNGNINKTVTIGNSVVNPIPLTIQADNETKYFGQANPALALTYIGFVNGDKAAQLAQQPVVTTIAVTNSAVGTYTIQVTGGASPNYSPITDLDGTLTILDAPKVLEIPNTFTPNGDGINDTWNIKNIDAYPNCSVEIYNRYGENVYSSVGYGIPWSGTYRGATLPSGTYYYMINLKNGDKVLSGYVAIIR